MALWSTYEPDYIDCVELHTLRIGWIECLCVGYRGVGYGGVGYGGVGYGGVC